MDKTDRMLDLTRRAPARNNGRTSADADRGERRRLAPEQREEEIVRAAVQFFAEFGFEGQTRELAKRLNITQPLLYRYFPTKDALVERVYQDVFMRRWNPFWESTIANVDLTLRERLVAFYDDYAKVILSYEWIRLFMFSGLKGLGFNNRYLDVLRERIFVPVIVQMRKEFGRELPPGLPVSAMEIELIWSVHAAIFYLGVRKFIYDMPVEDVTAIVEMKVTAMLDGAAAVIGR